VPRSRLVNREPELRRLRAHWAAVEAGAARLVVVTGRRQVGKTFLLSHQVDVVAKGSGPSRALLFTALPGASERQQLDAFATTMRQQFDEPFLPDRFDRWDAALRWLASTAAVSPVLVVIDEFPYLLESTPTMPGHLQQLWDEVRRTSVPPRLMLVLTGSSVAVMRAMSGSTGALFGRLDDELRIDPFDLPAAAEVLDRLEPATVLEAYAACGGYPHHLTTWDQRASTTENLQRLIFSPGGLLLRNGAQLIADVPEDGGYRRTLHAIGSGAHESSRVAASAGQRVERPIELLERATLVRLDRPLGSPDRTPGRWELTDAFLRGWYELCWADQERIEAGLGERIAEARAGRWQRHLGWVFEEQARAHAIRQAAAGELPSEARYGRWWSTRGAQVEIDILGMVGGRTLVIGEARWDARPLSGRVLEELKAKERAAPDPVAQPILCTWSRGGATPELGGAGVRSFGPVDMVARTA
jgi:hypothetical protein